MLEVISALIPPFVMAALFIAVAVTAIRATDGSVRRRTEEDPPTGNPDDRDRPAGSLPDERDSSE
jgi:hypothetical protein